jgi:uroporphyrin-III C-methyltransferase
MTITAEFEPDNTGLVYLIGAGPGDPDLITVKGLRVLQLADAVVYDYLVNELFLAEVKPGAELYYVGKKGGKPHIGQGEINDLLVRLAREGKLVARLKGGDSFVFGRGGEEALALQEAGLAFEVVPGVSSVIGVPAYAGIPVTHRQYTSSFTVITGHEDASRPLDDSRVNWRGLAKVGGTLVFLMGASRVADITANLVEAGLSASTPAAMIYRGSLPEQQTISGDLSNLAERVKLAGLKAPSIIIIGEVVRLREKLNWFEFPELEEEIRNFSDYAAAG